MKKCPRILLSCFRARIPGAGDLDPKCTPKHKRNAYEILGFLLIHHPPFCRVIDPALLLFIFVVSGVTILLSLTVFHNIVTETLPQVSDAMPLLGTF